MSNKPSSPRKSNLEQFLLRQLGSRPRRQMEAALSAIPDRQERIYTLLETHGDTIQIPPTPDEDAVYDELVEMIADCRNRTWGARSQANLVAYLTTVTIPELISFANLDR